MASAAGPQPGTPQAKPPSLPEGAPPQGPAAAGPFEKRVRFERRSRTSDPSRAPRHTGSSGRKLSAARAGRPAGRMTKFGSAPHRRLPFMADSPAADVAARAPPAPPPPPAEGLRARLRGGGRRRGAAGASPRAAHPLLPPPPPHPYPQLARPSLPDLPRGKLRSGEGRSPAKVTSHHGRVAPDDTQRPCFPAQGQDRDDTLPRARSCIY